MLTKRLVISCLVIRFVNEWRGTVLTSFFCDATFFDEIGERFGLLPYTSKQVFSFLVFLFFLTGETTSSLTPARSICPIILKWQHITEAIQDLCSQLAHLVEAHCLALSHHQSSSYLNTRMFPSERSWAVRNCSQPSPSSMPDWCRPSSTRQNLPRGLKIMAFWLLG